MAMRRKKIRLKYKKERVLFSDVLPYELPIIFSNRGFYRLLVRYGIHTDEGKLCWKDDTPKEVLLLLKLFLGGQELIDSEIKLGNQCERTIPYTYSILHKPNKARQLSIIHPLNQIEVVEFYEKYKDLILYYCSRSNFSMRYPNSVASYFYYRDRLHSELLGKKSDPVEMFFSEYENLRTYFSYKNYTNVYKFYEGYDYQRAEKKFCHLVKFDVQACFDSIYTHSISWAINGGAVLYKDTFDGADKSFGEKWDILMEQMNYGETNGIVIGPEFSRIFAEVILQQIDTRVEARLKEDGYRCKVDYDCYRYVDDHFFFYNEEKVRNKALKYFEEQLKTFKMSLSSEKTELLDRPFITDISRAKIRIDKLIKDAICLRVSDEQCKDVVELGEDADTEDTDGEDTESIKTTYSIDDVHRELDKKYTLYLSATQFNAAYKAILKDCCIDSKNVLNYTLSRISIRLVALLKQHNKAMRMMCYALMEPKMEVLGVECAAHKKDLEKKLSLYLQNVIDCVFFLYASNKRINSTLKVMQILNTCIEYLTNDYKEKGQVVKRFSDESRDIVLKKIQDEIATVFKAGKIDEKCQLETLYLLIVSGSMNRKYHLTSAELCKYLGIEKDLATGEIKTESLLKLHALSSIILIYYCKNNTSMFALKNAVVAAAIQRIRSLPSSRVRRSAEYAILASDMMTCPYIRRSDKEKIGQTMGLSRLECDKLIQYFGGNKYLFTRWTGVNLTKELNAKNSQEVYS